MTFQEVISTISEQQSGLPFGGEVAQYIDELRLVNPNKFGVYLKSVSGEEAYFGDAFEAFSIQSIAKVLALSLVYKELGESLWKRVGVEPSGNPFNSLVQLEYDSGIPRNPFINAGALVVCDIILSLYPNPEKAFLAFANSVSGHSDIVFNERIAESEKKNGFRNAALVNLMKSFGNIKNEVEAVLDFYFKLCSITLSCKDLAEIFQYLSIHGKHPLNGNSIISESQTKRINAIMQTCGFYDEAGEFTFKVGLPGKSGVGGGIIAIHPNQYTIAVWSPRLNKKGNSAKGMAFLEEFTTMTTLSIF
ncbi:glutaminase [bacterium]|nr:MAG: glutaminase [bacterium]